VAGGEGVFADVEPGDFTLGGELDVVDRHQPGGQRPVDVDGVHGAVVDDGAHTRDSRVHPERHVEKGSCVGPLLARSDVDGEHHLLAVVTVVGRHVSHAVAGVAPVLLHLDGVGIEAARAELSGLLVDGVVTRGVVHAAQIGGITDEAVADPGVCEASAALRADVEEVADQHGEVLEYLLEASE